MMRTVRCSGRLRGGGGYLPTGGSSSGSSGRVRGGAEKHEINAAAFGSHLFYDLFTQGQGGRWPPRPPWIRYWGVCLVFPGVVSGRPPPLWTEFLTHACENITFPQLRWRSVKIQDCQWVWRSYRYVIRLL